MWAISTKNRYFRDGPKDRKVVELFLLKSQPRTSNKNTDFFREMTPKKNGSQFMYIVNLHFQVGPKKREKHGIQITFESES